MGGTRISTRTLRSDNFVVHYSLSGPGAVRVGKGGKGQPDYVGQVVYWAERALEIYTGSPFLLENPARRKRIHIVVDRLPGLGRASRKGVLFLGNKLAPDLMALTVAHELFHLVQYQYPRNGGRWRPAVIEGGAVYAEQFVTGVRYDTGEPAEGRQRSFGRLVKEPERPLSGAAYDCALFWDYIGHKAALHRKHADPTDLGPALYKSVLRHCASHGYSASGIRRVLHRRLPELDLYRFSYDGTGPDATLASGETLVGNFAMACCLADNGLFACDPRFSLVGADTADGSESGALAVPGSARTKPCATGIRTLERDRSITLAGTLGDFSSAFRGIILRSEVEAVQVRLSTDGRDRGLLLQIGLLDELGDLFDVVRTDRAHARLAVRVAQQHRRVARILIVMTGIADCTDYTVRIEPSRRQSKKPRVERGFIVSPEVMAK